MTAGVDEDSNDCSLNANSNSVKPIPPPIQIPQSPGRVKPTLPEESLVSPTSTSATTLNDIYKRVREKFVPSKSNARSEKSSDTSVGKGGLLEVLTLYDKLKQSPSFDGQTVTIPELCRCLEELGVGLNDMEVETLAMAYDTTISGGVPIDQFLRDCGGAIDSKRLTLVRLAFSLLDTDGNGAIRVQDIKLKYTTAEHPRVRSGELTAVWRELVSYFERDRPDGMVYPVEWEFFYAGKSSTIASDEFFEKAMFSCWPGLKQDFSPGDLSGKSKSEVAAKVRKLGIIVNDRRTFRDALALAFRRTGQMGDHSLGKVELYNVVSGIYSLAGITSELDETTFNTIHRRVTRETGTKARTPSEYEAALRDALISNERNRE